MNFQKYIDEMKNILDCLLGFLENQENENQFFQNLIKIFDDQKIYDDQYKIKSILHLLNKISNSHYRVLNFFTKIEQILICLKNYIKKYYSNWEIFNIFKNNKRILLFLIDNKIMNMDERVAKEISTKYKYEKANYPEYFAPELKSFINKNWFRKKEDLLKKINEKIPENFNELRKEGENENFICKLIRNDLIEKFIVYINQTNLSLETKIQKSIYETNYLIIKKHKRFSDSISLIEYAAFFGSIQIFKYLQINGVKMTPSLWPFVIHGKNAELIHILEENKIGLQKDNQNITYKQLLIESIKCHHNEIAKYFQDNFVKSDEEKSQDIIKLTLKFYNFNFIDETFITNNSFLLLCKFDYYILVKSLLEHQSAEINSNDISKKLFKSNFKSYL